MNLTVTLKLIPLWLPRTVSLAAPAVGEIPVTALSRPDLDALSQDFTARLYAAWDAAQQQAHRLDGGAYAGTPAPSPIPPMPVLYDPLAELNSMGFLVAEGIDPATVADLRRTGVGCGRLAERGLIVSMARPPLPVSDVPTVTIDGDGGGTRIGGGGRVP
jgi:hypothetical protein